MTVELEASKTQVIDQALKLTSVKDRTGGKLADRVVHVPDRLLKLIYTESGQEKEQPPEKSAEPFFDPNM